MPKQEWRLYQDTVAAVFRSLGAAVEVEHVLRGVRARHEIDVYVSFERWGVRQSWIIECKLLNRSVTKAHVLTLKSILDDVGGDRALLVSNRGFQPGAVSAAARTSISLTSLPELQAVSRPDVLGLLAGSLERTTLECLASLRSFIYGWAECSREQRAIIFAVEDHLAEKKRHRYGSDDHKHGGFFSGGDTFHVLFDDDAQFEERMFLKAGIDLQVFMAFYIELTMLRTGFDRIKLNQFPVRLKAGSATDLEQFVVAAEDVTSRASAWYSAQAPRSPGSASDSFGHTIHKVYQRWLI